jgi:DNA-binding beta-propeller fold protein YncE
MVRGRMAWWHLAALAILAAAAGCVEDPPVTPPGDINGDSLRGVLVVNEGLQGQDNSTLTFHDPATGETVQDFFARRNPGLRLGDTGNDIDIRNDRAYIVVSRSQNIEVLELPSGRSLGRIRIGGGDPRKLAIVDDSTGFVTLFSDEVVRVDLRRFTVGARAPVGPAPEGLAAIAGRVFVANSGMGFLRQREPKAGTVSVLDARTGGETALLHPGPNPQSLLADTARGLVLVQYGMPDADSLGGVVAYDALTLAEVRRWSVRGAGVAGEMALDAERGLLYVVDGEGSLVRIAVSSPAGPQRFLLQSPPSRLGFYGVGVSPTDGAIYASYVTSYVLPGAVIVYERDGRLRGRFDAGLNPSSFGFFQPS